MRNFIKSHKRTELLEIDFRPPMGKAKSTTPLGSPRIPQSGASLAVSSPKKLLTPIKKMFGHKPAPGILQTGDTLASVLNGAPSPKVRNVSSFSTLSDLKPKLNKSHGSAALLDPLPLAQAPRYLQHDSSDTAIVRRDMPILGKRFSLKNASSLSLVASEKFQAKLALLLECFADALSKMLDSDSGSSQFSFEKDMRQGRNVSVKYYKTPKPKTATFEDDLARADMGLSDYDYDNNGMDSDDQDDEPQFDLRFNFLEGESPNDTEGSYGITGEFLDNYLKLPLDSSPLRINSPTLSQEHLLEINSQIVPKRTARDSVIEMMETLDKLELSRSLSRLEILTKQPDAAKLRSSLSNLMSTLERLEVSEMEKSDKIRDYSSHLDRDLQEEVNRMPEDYDFDATEPDVPDFYRSNSYTNRPTRAASDGVWGNKIETPQKTVTFYHSGGDKTKGSVSRGGSLYSSTSVTVEEPRTKTPYSLSINPVISRISGESVSPVNLAPITESLH